MVSPVLAGQSSVATPLAPAAAPAVVIPSAVVATKAILVPYSVVDPTTNKTTALLCAECGIRRLNTTQATATGMLFGAGNEPSLARSVRLQHYVSSAWKTIATGDSDATTGMVTLTFSISSAPRWSPRNYRIYAPAVTGAASVTSATTKFLPGPGVAGSTSYPLGKNVLRVSVNNTVYPTSKTTIYKGSLTYTQAGQGTTAPLPLENFAVRGGTTAKLAKKPYKLKFENDRDLFDAFNGVGGNTSTLKTKRFNLLALFVDNTLMRDKLALDLARRQTPANAGKAADIPSFLARENLQWTSRAEHTELYVNDQYLGVYLITDATKIDSTRVRIDKQKGSIVEADNPDISSDAIEWKTPKSQYIKFEDPDTYKNLVTKAEQVSTPSWPADQFDPEAVTIPKRDAVKAQVSRLESAIYARDWTRIQKYLDVDSTVDWYLVREFTKDVDADFYRSSTFFLPDYTACPTVPVDQCDATGKFYFGPVWDFDRSAGATTKSSAIASTSGWYVRGISAGYTSRDAHHYNQWFKQLGQTSGFMNLVRARWALKKAEYAQVGNTDVEAMYSTLVGSEGDEVARAASDRMRWSGYTRAYGWRSSTFLGEKDFVKNWYKGRYSWVNSNI
ncbi:MAG: CotH kinase family protein [Micropruina sp.]